MAGIAPKKIKLNVKLTALRADRATAADQVSNQPPAESSRAAGDRPRMLDPPGAAPQRPSGLEPSQSEVLVPQHTLAPESRAAAGRPEGSERPLKAAAARARLSEPARAASNRPGHSGLPKVGCSCLFQGVCLCDGASWTQRMAPLLNCLDKFFRYVCIACGMP